MDKKYKIGFFLLLLSDKPGGAERRYFRLYNYLKKIEKEMGLNYNFVLITSKHTSKILTKYLDLKYFNDNEVIYIYNPVLYSLPKMIKLIFRLFISVINSMIVAYHIRRKKISLIHFCIDPNEYCFFFSYFSKILKINYSFSFVNSIFFRETLFKKFVYKICLEKNNHFFVECLGDNLSNNLKIYFKKIKEDKIHVAPCSFTLQENINKNILWQDVSVKKEIDFVMLSRFLEDKGYDFLFEAIKLILNDISKKLNAKIRLYGFGPLEDYIQREVEFFKNRGIDIDFSYCDNPAEVLLKSKYLLSLQKYENYPSQSILEAFSLRVPVIATDVGDTRQLVNNSTGFLVKTPQDLSNLMIELTSKPYSIENFLEGFNNVLLKNNIENYALHFLRLLDKYKYNM